MSHSVCNLIEASLVLFDLLPTCICPTSTQPTTNYNLLMTLTAADSDWTGLVVANLGLDSAVIRA